MRWTRKKTRQTSQADCTTLTFLLEVEFALDLQQACCGNASSAQRSLRNTVPLKM